MGIAATLLSSCTIRYVIETVDQFIARIYAFQVFFNLFISGNNASTPKNCWIKHFKWRKSYSIDQSIIPWIYVFTDFFSFQTKKAIDYQDITKSIRPIKFSRSGKWIHEKSRKHIRSYLPRIIAGESFINLSNELSASARSYVISL